MSFDASFEKSLQATSKKQMAFFCLPFSPYDRPSHSRTITWNCPLLSRGVAPASLGRAEGGRRRRRRRRRGAKAGPAEVDQVRKAPYSLQIILIIIFYQKSGNFLTLRDFVSKNSQEPPPKKKPAVFSRQGGVRYKFFLKSSYWVV